MREGKQFGEPAPMFCGPLPGCLRRGAGTPGTAHRVASYSDHVEREHLCAALVANSACLACLAVSKLGVDPEKLPAGVA